jgi:hypothetical protein
MAVEAGPPDALRTAEVEHLRGQIALDQRRGPDATRLLLSAARRFEPLNPPWPARPTWKPCTTASASTTPRATRPGGHSSPASWGTGRW